MTLRTRNNGSGQESTLQRPRKRKTNNDSNPTKIRNQQSKQTPNTNTDIGQTEAIDSDQKSSSNRTDASVMSFKAGTNNIRGEAGPTSRVASRRRERQRRATVSGRVRLYKPCYIICPMVAQNALGTCEELFLKIKFEDCCRCERQIKFPVSFYTCASFSQLPSILCTTMLVLPG